ncbi:MAG: helix-hairpin-helix domain-containing protein, partial [Anaerolineae bacterium]|nr:helix-hairpin-helix domain-containing protein [Anaerolineae bacterium]
MEEWHRGLLFFLLMLAILAVIVFLQVPRPQDIVLPTQTPLPTPQSTPTPHPLRVYVSGAVRQPDVYFLVADSIVKDAVVAAGGATEDADLDRINLALPIADGQHVYVPRLGEEDPPAGLPAAPRSSSGRVNINLADSDALESLPGIGPSLAQRILAYREANGRFIQSEDIMKVPGIGPATFEKIRELI